MQTGNVEHERRKSAK